jgi:acyl carrier protein
MRGRLLDHGSGDDGCADPTRAESWPGQAGLRRSAGHISGKEVIMIVLDEVIDMIRKKMRRKLPDDIVLTADTELDNLGLSSLQIADIVFALEDKFDFEFDLDRTFGIKTIGEVVMLVNEMLSEFQA